MQVRIPNRGGRFGRPNQLQPRRQAVPPAINQQPGPPAIQLPKLNRPAVAMQQPAYTGGAQPQQLPQAPTTLDGATKQKLSLGGINPGTMAPYTGGAQPAAVPQAPAGDRQNMASLNDGISSGLTLSSAPTGDRQNMASLNDMGSQPSSTNSMYSQPPSTPSAPQSPQSFYGDRQNMSVLDDSSPSSNQYQAGTAMASVPQQSQGFYGGGGIQPGGGLLAQMKSGQPSSNPSQGFYGGGAPGGLLSGMKNAGGFQAPGMGATPPKPSFGGSGGFPGGGAAGRFRGPTK